MKSLSLRKPHVIVMVGIPGSGKSFFAERFADTFNAPLVSAGKIHQALFSDPVGSTDERTMVRNMSDLMLDELYKTQRTIIFEGASDARTDRQTIAKRSREAGYETLFVWVQTELATAKWRVNKAVRAHSSIKPDQFDATLKRFSAPHAHEKVVVISGKHTYASQLKIVLKRLVEPRIELIEKQTPPKRPAGNRTIVVR